MKFQLKTRLVLLILIALLINLSTENSQNLSLTTFFNSVKDQIVKISKFGQSNDSGSDLYERSIGKNNKEK